MSITKTSTNVNELKINYLTQSMYDDALANNQINDNELYMTPFSYDSFVDFFYPVGSYYETSDTTFDPNISWGGTWSLETEGQVHVSSGANYTVGGALTDTSDGGSKDAIVVSHDHTFTGNALGNHGHTFTGNALGNHGHTFTGTALGNHSHGTGNSTQNRFALYRSTTDGILRRTIKNGTGTSYEGNVYTTDTWARAASTQAVSAGTPSGTVVGNSAGTPSGTVVGNSAGTPSGSISTEGSGGTDANMQPYIVVNRWHRTA